MQTSTVTETNITDDYQLKCPKCHEIFTIKDFENNLESKAHFLAFFNHFYQNKLESLKLKIETEANAKYESQLENDLEKQRVELLLKTDNEKHQVEKKYLNDIKQLTTLNEKLRAEVQSNAIKADKAVAEAIQIKTDQFNEQKNNLQTFFNKEVNELVVKNEKLKAKLENITIEKDKQLAQQLQLKVEQYNKQKILDQEVHSKKVSDLIVTNEQLKSQLASFQTTKDKDISEILHQNAEKFNTARNELQSKYTEKSLNYEREISSLTNQLNTIKLEFEAQLSKDKAETLEKFGKDKTELLEAHQAETKKLNEKITKLEVDNARNNVLNNKIRGNNLEANMQEVLVDLFAFDNIEKITTPGHKADILQKVNAGASDGFVGNIAYEIKNTTNWDDNWERKFVDDMLTVDAKYGIIAATAFPKKFGANLFIVSHYNPNMYLTSHENAPLVAQIIRTFLITEYQIQKSSSSLGEAQLQLNKIRDWKDKNLTAMASKVNISLEGLDKVLNGLRTQTKNFEKHLTILKGNFIDQIIAALDELIQ